METVFDILDQRPLDRAEWAQIFTHHVRLHGAWLRDNPGTFEPDYIAYTRSLIEEPAAISLSRAA